MDQDNSSSSANGVVEKTASQLKKEAQRQAKMEKFAKKKEKEAALMENQNQVIRGGFQFKGVFWRIDHFLAFLYPSCYFDSHMGVTGCQSIKFYSVWHAPGAIEIE